jgi:hypothetical protein
VLYDYFRAADASAVAKLMTDIDGGPLVTGDATHNDAVDCKGIDPAVALGQAIAMIVGRDWDTDVVTAELVWSEDEQEGPWVMELGATADAALADLDDAAVPELARRWAGIEEFYGEADPELLEECLRELSGLARRAREHGERVYVWCSL